MTMELEQLTESAGYFENICQSCNDKYGIDEKGCNECPVWCARECIRIVTDAKEESIRRKVSQVTS